ncbi:unnamed protein product [Polarella glacialis]|uniref:Uncharacterized protein n=1 Tax=Polarella glacialis TaxID=89957 RepID=A0A813LFP2_POLGL|nr:unnamed protein product [Polarella glacialis]
MASWVLWLAKELSQHRRANKLHRESLALALRVHEAESFAGQEYHRVLLRASNDQHAREVLQKRYQHEEDIDNERRVATRDNIRDDWQKLSDRAETVLIVNTLVLAVAFAMLIEGNLPDSTFWTLPVVAVSYLCSVSCSLCMLISSVRFAVVLRFRVGRIIVEEMREAIARTTILDDRFREHQAYRRCNWPEMTMPACKASNEQPTRVSWYTSPLTSQMHGRDAGSVADEGSLQSTYFTPILGQGYEDLSWVAAGAIGPAQGANVAAIKGTGPLSTPVLSKQFDDKEDLYSSTAPGTEQPSPSLELPLSQESLEAYYQELVKLRLEHCEQDRVQLKKLQIVHCQPWDLASQQLLACGCLMLLVASCLLVFGRFYEQDYFESSFWRVRSLAAWSFTTPCMLTMLVLAYSETLLHGVRQRRRSVRQLRRDRRSLDEASSARASALREGSSRASMYSPSSSLLLSGTGSSELDLDSIMMEENANRDVAAIGRALRYLVLGSLPAFAAAAAYISRMQGQLAPGTFLASTTLPSELMLRPLELEPDVSWPGFIAPSFSAWISERQALLLVWGLSAVEVVVSPGSGLARPSLQRMQEAFVGLCSSRGGVFGITAANGQTRELQLEQADVDRHSSRPSTWRTVSIPDVRIDGIFGSLMRPGALSCREADANSSIQIWLAAGPGALGGSTPPEGKSGNASRQKALEPYLLGATLEGGCTQNASSSSEGIMPCRANRTWRWPLRWLLWDRSVSSLLDGLSHQGRYDDVELRLDAIAASEEGLLALVTMQVSSDIRFQLVAQVSSNGSLQQSWRISPPPAERIPCDGKLSGHHCGWTTIALDEGRRRLYLTANIGPVPLVVWGQLPL